MSDIRQAVTFTIGNQGDHYVAAELDTRPIEDGGFNASRLGKTTGFQPGEEISFLIYYDSDALEVDFAVDSLIDAGSTINLKKSVEHSITVEDTLSFVNTRTASLSRFAKSGFSVGDWIGNDLTAHFGGDLELDADLVTVKLPPLPKSMQITPELPEYSKSEYLKKQLKPGICQVKYTTKAIEGTIKLPDADRMENYGKPPFQVAILIVMKEKDG